MSPKTDTKAQWSLDSASLRDSYTDFFLSRQAAQCSPSTLEFYKYMLGPFLAWAEQQGIRAPDEVTARQVRAYLAGLVEAGKSDTTVYDHARAIRTLLMFWLREGYIGARVEFDMPKVAKKRLPVLTADELRKVLSLCNVRDKAIVALMADSGLRRAEVCALNWDDIDFSNGLLRVKRGKGGKARSAVVGAVARRALLAYRRTVPADGPMFTTQRGERFKPWGLGVVFKRLAKRTGIRVTPHALRRTFVILSLRNGMPVPQLQALGGWEDLTMLVHYAQLEDIDLIQAHHEHSPIDHLRPRRMVRQRRRRQA